eukprot:69604_1
MSRFDSFLFKTSQRVASTQRTLPAFANIDKASHSAEEQAVLNRFEHESVDKVILHTLPKGICKYGYCTTFAGKIESYLKYNKINYSVDDKMEILLPLPISKTPWITYTGIHTADSQIIIERLNEELNIDNDKHLTTEQRAISFAFRTTMDVLYFVDIYRRYKNTKENNIKYMSHVFPENEEMAIAISDKFQEYVLAQLFSQGIGRFDGDYVYKLYVSQIDSVLNYMDNGPFFFGDKISSVDFAIYSQFGSIYSIDLLYPNTVKFDGKLHRTPEVVEYLQRFEQEINQK